MSLPQNLTSPAEEPAAPADPIPEASVDSASTEPTTEPAPVDDATAAEDASDAELRTWARDNGIDGVPATGRLSATWREQITAAIAAAAEPPPAEEEPEPVVEEELVVEEPVAEEEPEAEEVKPVAPEWETGVYRSVFQAPDTFVTSQAYTT